MAADDTSVALVQLQSGAAAVLVESFSLKTPQPGVHGSVHGAHGSLWFHDAEIRLYTAEQDGHAQQVETIETPAQNPFEAEWRHFLDCIETGAEPITSARTQRQPLAAVLAVYASFASGQRVYV
jgi:predicted dehydrogenase